MLTLILQGQKVKGRGHAVIKCTADFIFLELIFHKVTAYLRFNGQFITNLLTSLSVKNFSALTLLVGWQEGHLA